ncbi:MAG: zinc-ribbon domain-containing protein [Caldilineaceae bacterium]
MPSRFCTECGTELQPGQRFCPECGTAVQQPAEDIAAAPASTPKPAVARRSSGMPLGLLLGLGGLAIVIVLVVTYWATAKPPAIVGNFPVETSADGIPFPTTPRISVADAKAGLDAGTAIFVDVRSQAQFDAGHIPGAVLMPLDEFEARFSELPQDAEILTYCT